MDPRSQATPPPTKHRTRWVGTTVGFLLLAYLVLRDALPASPGSDLVALLAFTGVTIWELLRVRRPQEARRLALTTPLVVLGAVALMGLGRVLGAPTTLTNLLVLAALVGGMACRDRWEEQVPLATTQPVSSTRPQSEAMLLGGENPATRSAAEGLRAFLKLHLDLVKATLGLRTVALYWIDPARETLELCRISPAHDTSHPRRLGLGDGIVGAAVTQRVPLSVAGAHARRHAGHPEYPEGCGGLCAVPLTDDQEVVGVLLADRVLPHPFSDAEVSLLSRAAQLMVRAVENERVLLHLERSKLEQYKLYRAVEQLASASTEAAVIEAGVEAARQFAAFDCASVTLYHRQDQKHEICAASGEGWEALVGQRFAHDSSLVAMVVENRQPLPYRSAYDPQRQPLFARGITTPALTSVLVLPLSVHDRVLGTLILGSNTPDAFVGAVRSTLEVLAAHLAVSLSNARMLRRLEDLATTDGLTGLLNKRTFLEIAQQKLKSAERFRRPVSVLVCDIDFFKKVNDTYGHDVGDLVLKGFSQILIAIKRDVDLVGRFGGEEFVLVCEETAEHGAVLLAERIREELSRASFPSPKGDVSVTCSVGVASFPACGQTWDQLFKCADEALYASKQQGRNRVTVAKGRSLPPAPPQIRVRMELHPSVRQHPAPS